ncbi:MAG TPA: hypothetical protein VFK27_01950, partial [Bacillales bacterium]|nr:hypothetical protein [Bacillales bacterium]
ETNFIIPCRLLSQDRASLQKAIRDVMAHLFDASGKPKTMPLIFDDEPEVSYNVRYSGRFPISRVIGIGDFSISLTAYDPHGYAEITAYDPSPVPQYDTGLQYDSGLMYPNPTSFDWLYSTQYVGLYNYAFLNTPVRIIVSGAVINPRITNQTTGQSLTVNVATGANDLLVIDTERFYVLKSTPTYEQYFLSTTFPAGFMHETQSTNLFSEQYGDDDLYLAPGENSLKFEGGLPNASVQIVWKHRYL